MVVGLMVLFAGTRARAQQEDPAPFGQARQVVISAERLFGFVHAEATASQNGGPDTTTNINAVSLLGNTLGFFTPFAAPRVGFDVFAADRFSIGASVSYFHASESLSAPAGVTASAPTLSGFVLAPRVGFALALGRTVSFWPRLGFTLVRLQTELTDTGIGANPSTTETTTLYALTVEAPFVIVVSPHLFLSAAPTLDLGIGGSTSTSGGGAIAAAPSTSSKETDFGVLCGLGGFF